MNNKKKLYKLGDCDEITKVSHPLKNGGFFKIVNTVPNIIKIKSEFSTGSV